MLGFYAMTLFILLAVISPGPDFAVVSRNALCYSQKTGVFTAFGIACSTLFHSSYCILGLAIIISKSLLLFNIVKYIGASYLIYLGIRGIFDKQTAAKISGKIITSPISAFQAFRQGLFCNALNPKCILFFLAMFTMIIKPTMPRSVQIAYAFEIALIHFSWFALVSILLAHNRVKLFLGRFLNIINKTFGGLLIFFGLKVATIAHQ